MNIAPIALQERADWSLAETEVSEDVSRAIDVHAKLIQELIDTAFLRTVAFDDVSSASSPPHRLQLMGLHHWRRMTSAIKGESPGEPPYRFCKAYALKSGSSVLLAPDDSSSIPNIAVFMPSTDLDNRIVLHSIRLWLGEEPNQVVRVDTAGDGKCTLTIDGELPNQTFDCAETGCTTSCVVARQTERGHAVTLYCRCRSM